jgi:hypothetical protein
MKWGGISFRNWYEEVGTIAGWFSKYLVNFSGLEVKQPGLATSLIKFSVALSFEYCTLLHKILDGCFMNHKSI